MSTSHSQPLDRIVQAIQAVKDGKYSPALLETLFTTDDLGELARAVDTMARGVSSRDRQLELLQRVIPVGVALSAEKDFDRLLETLVVEAQSLTGADAGT